MVNTNRTIQDFADKRNTQMGGDDWDYGDGTYSINWDGHDAQVVQDFRCTVTEVAGEIRAMVQANKTVEMRALIASFGEEVADIAPFTLLPSPFTLRVSPFTLLMPSALSHSYSSSLCEKKTQYRNITGARVILRFFCTLPFIFFVFFSRSEEEYEWESKKKRNITQYHSRTTYPIPRTLFPTLFSPPANPRSPH